MDHKLFTLFDRRHLQGGGEAIWPGRRGGPVVIPAAGPLISLIKQFVELKTIIVQPLICSIKPPRPILWLSVPGEL